MTCDNCDRVQEMYVEASENEQAALQALRKEQASHRGTKAMLMKELKEGPTAEDGREVADFWMARLKKRPNTTFGPERQKKVQARLAEKPLAGADRKQDLKWAVMGCEAVPFVGDKGRQSQGGKRHDDLALICRDETTVERFISYADDEVQRVYNAIVGALARVYGGALIPEFTPEQLDQGMDRDAATVPRGWYSPCPCHLSIADLNVRPGDPACLEFVQLQCVNGCDPESIKATLRDLVQRKAA